MKVILTFGWVEVGSVFVMEVTQIPLTIFLIYILILGVASF